MMKPTPMRRATASSVHITGLERSGKTTLAAFLQAHSQLAVPPVGTNMWHYFAFRYGSLSDPGNLEACLDAMFSYDRIRWLSPDRETIERDFSAGEPSYGRLFGLFMEQYAVRMSKPIWGTQSAWLDWYVDSLYSADADTRVIHVLRDSYDRYAEVKANWPEGRGEAGAAAARWNLAVKMAGRNERKYRGRYRVIRFEDLVADPPGVLAGVCELIGLDFEDRMLEAVKRNTSEILSGAEKPLLVEVLSSDALRAAERELLPAETGFLQGVTKRRRRQRGYEIVDLGLSRMERLGQFTRYWPGQMLRYVAWTLLEHRSRLMPVRYGEQIDPEYVIEHVES
jgi:hypothetical protein